MDVNLERYDVAVLFVFLKPATHLYSMSHCFRTTHKKRENISEIIQGKHDDAIAQMCKQTEKDDEQNE